MSPSIENNFKKEEIDCIETQSHRQTTNVAIFLLLLLAAPRRFVATMNEETQQEE